MSFPGKTKNIGRRPLLQFRAWLHTLVALTVPREDAVQSGIIVTGQEKTTNVDHSIIAGRQVQGSIRDIGSWLGSQESAEMQMRAPDEGG